MRILFDTNVVLDVLLDRDPFVQSAALLFEATAQEELTGFLGATTVTTISYLVANTEDSQSAREGIRGLLRLFDVAAVDRQVLSRHAEIHSFESHSERPTTGGRSELKNLSKPGKNASFGEMKDENGFCQRSKRFLDSASLRSE